MNATNLAPQILVGRISSSNKDGILVSLDFFDDVFIPSYLLQAPSEFNAETSLWLWKYGEEDSGDEFVMDIGEQVKTNFFESCPQYASPRKFPKHLPIPEMFVFAIPDLLRNSSIKLSLDTTNTFSPYRFGFVLEQFILPG